jgi:hypothetical protein
MIYVCGDSFGVPDCDYGPMWADYLGMHHTVTNLSRVCASNLMISRQVDIAIEQQAQYVILLCTASTRGQTRLDNEVVPYSIHSLDHTAPFDDRQLCIFKSYTAEFFDLDLAIYENKCIIESMLSRLVASNIPFVFDQGGFEHHSYGGVGTYFTHYHQYRSRYNLWDYADVRTYRPYYHIQNDKVHQEVARYYAGLINEQA